MLGSLCSLWAVAKLSVRLGPRVIYLNAHAPTGADKHHAIRPEILVLSLYGSGVFELDLRNLVDVLYGEPPDDLFARPVRPLIETRGPQEKPRGARRGRSEGEGTVGIMCNFHPNRNAFNIVRSLIVELFAEVHQVQSSLAQGGSYWGLQQDENLSNPRTRK